MLVAEPDMEWVFIDGSYAKAHQHSAGAASANDEATPSYGCPCKTATGPNNATPASLRSDCLSE